MSQISTQERAVVVAVAEFMREQATALPVESKVRAWLLRIQAPLADYVGLGPLLENASMTPMVSWRVRADETQTGRLPADTPAQASGNDDDRREQVMSATSEPTTEQVTIKVQDLRAAGTVVENAAPTEEVVVAHTAEVILLVWREDGKPRQASIRDGWVIPDEDISEDGGDA
jgi:hypothetical protein